MKSLRDFMARSSRPSLVELGVHYKYDPAKTDLCPYEIRLKADRMNSPRDSAVYLDQVVTAIAEDLRIKGGILELGIDDLKYKDRLSAVAEMLEFNGKKQERRCKLIQRGFEAVPAVTFGAIGFFLGYGNFCDIATNVANHINQSGSHYLAPITGLLQLGISLGGTAVTTGIGAASWFSGRYTSRPFQRFFAPLGMLVTEYGRVKDALSNARDLQALPAAEAPPEREQKQPEAAPQQ